jgi:RNA polymerase sigma-70 factor (ECF subfamily)
MASSPTADRHERFEALFAACYVPVRAYALRRAAPEVAQDVIADTFMVAWRRLDDVPAQPLPWLYGVARRTLANARRSSARAEALGERVAAAESRAATTADLGDQLGEAEAIRSALAALSDDDRETIMLVAWDGLEPAAAASAAGCSRATFAVRLHRARRRLAAALAIENADAPVLEPTARELSP